MAKTKEGGIKAQINKVLTAPDIYSFMPVQMGYGKAGLDYHCGITWKSVMLAFWIEAKENNKEPTPRQNELIKELRQRKAKVFTIRNIGGIEELKEWIARVRSSQ